MWPDCEALGSAVYCISPRVGHTFPQTGGQLQFQAKKYLKIPTEASSALPIRLGLTPTHNFSDLPDLGWVHAMHPNLGVKKSILEHLHRGHP